MAVKKIRPVTPGQRYRMAPDFKLITKPAPEKALTKPLKKSGGRNNVGKMTMRYLGGGHKRKYRIIDFIRSKRNVPGTVKAIEYDPNRSARIALIYYADGEKSYILAPAGIKIGQTVISGDTIAPEVGNHMPLANIPLGTIIHNIELRPGKGGVLARSAGSYAQLVAREGKYATLKLPSGEMRMVLSACYVTIGSVSNVEHMNETLGKAGRNRWLGRRPRVRGVAMNPVDHPMGGGEGRATGGHPRSRTGLYAKGKKTRHQHKYSDGMIISKRK
jgi:large subunit ribosomal protein L2